MKLTVDIFGSVSRLSLGLSCGCSPLFEIATIDEIMFKSFANLSVSVSVSER